MNYYEIDEDLDESPKIGQKVIMKFSRRIGYISNIIHKRSRYSNNIYERFLIDFIDRDGLYCHLESFNAASFEIIE